MKKTFALATLAAVAVGSSAAADILWNQSDYNNDPLAAASVNQQFPDFGSFSTYQLGDAAFASAVTITDVTIYTTNLNNGSWVGAGQAVINVFANDGSGLPGGGDDPTAGAIVDIDVVADGSGTTLIIHAGGLSIAAGANSWVGLTPIFSFAGDGQEFQRTTLSGVQGSESVIRNPGGGFGLGGDWIGISGLPGGAAGDGAMLIEGTFVPAPGALALLGLAGFAARRRRRA